MTNARKERIITMTKLAAYDKNKAAADNRVDGYFLHDYIYKSNMQTRIAVITGAIIIIGFNFLHRVLNENLDITTLDYTAELKKAGLYILAAAVFYTVIGSIKAARDYHLCRKRIQDYKKNLDKLAAYKQKRRKTEDTKTHGRSSIVYTRGTH